MPILELLARGVQTSPLDVARAGTQGFKDASNLQTASLDRQSKQMELDDFLLGRESLAVQRQVDVQKNQEFLANEQRRKDDYKAQQEQAKVDASLKERAMQVNEDKYPTALEIAKLRLSGKNSNKSKPVTKLSTKSKAEFVGAMLDKNEMFGRLSDDAKKGYLTSITQAIEEYSATNKVSTLEAMQAVVEFSGNFIDKSGWISQYSPVGYSNEFDADSFRQAFSEKMRAPAATTPGAPAPPGNADVKSFVNGVLGR